MRILVFNAGSSSLKFGVFDMRQNGERIFSGEYEGFKDGLCRLHTRIGDASKQTCTLPLADINAAIAHVPVVLEGHNVQECEALGHRIAHGGEHFHDAIVIDEQVIELIEACTPLAPLHNPANVAALRLARQLWPNAPHVAVFDTAFHHTIPESAYSYAVPKQWRDAGLRRYGFHGTSHKYVGMRVAQTLARPMNDVKIISCHLGNGASVCAINRGFSVDTSMGMTPLEGLMMGTRSGDVDPGLFSYLHRTLGLSIAQIEDALYRESGLKGLAGSHDLRDVEERAAQGDGDAQLAIHVYAYRVRKYIGAYAAVMGGVDALAFTGGIGENSASMRRRVCDRLGFLGLHLDDVKNQAIALQGDEVETLHSYDSRIAVLVTQTAEQWMIAKETQQLLQQQQPAGHIPVAVSARHVHLSEGAVEALFGSGYRLRKMKDLSQPEGWAAHETVEVIGPKGTLRHVRVLGPVRERTQIEVSKTDTFTLGVEAPVRPSGVLESTPHITLRGPAGELRTDGLIIAARHIHMHPNDAQRIGVTDGSYVDVRLGDDERGVLFTHTLIRVKDSYVTEMHIDTDEANAAGISTHSDGELVLRDTQHSGNIVKRLSIDMQEGKAS